MNSHNNIEYLIHNENVDSDKNLNILEYFTLQRGLKKRLLTLNPMILKYIEKVKKKENNYTFKYEGKTYPFEILSEKDKIQKVDCEILSNIKERYSKSTIRTLKLASHLDTINPKIVVGKTRLDHFICLLLVDENNKEKIIDYSKNLIMEKNDYKELFKLRKFNFVEKKNLYLMKYFFDDLFDEFPMEMLLFSREFIKELSKTHPILKNNNLNRNLGIYSLWGDGSDSLFFTEDDYKNLQYFEERNLLNYFTMFPDFQDKNIKYISDNKYEIKVKGLGKIDFGLISNIVKDYGTVLDLLSENRYGKCHYNAPCLAKAIGEVEPNTYLVSGKVMINDKDSFSHSWVESKQNNEVLVYDYNTNLIMKKIDYYRLYGAKPVNKTKASNIEKIFKKLEDIPIDFNIIDIDYFGEDIYRDLNKNTKILKKQL